MKINRTNYVGGLNDFEIGQMYADMFGPGGENYLYCVETDFTSYDST